MTKLWTFSGIIFVCPIKVGSDSPFEQWKISMDSGVNQVQIHVVVLVNENVAYTSEPFPGDFGHLGPGLVGESPDGLTDDLQASNDGVLLLTQRKELVTVQAGDISLCRCG